MTIYIIIRSGVIHDTCYTSLRAASREINGPHTETIRRAIKKFGIYNKNSVIIKKILVQKIPVRNKSTTRNLKNFRSDSSHSYND